MRILVLSLYLMWTLSLSFQAVAYSFTEDFDKGFYWPSFPILMKKIIVEDDDSELLNELVAEAEEEWEEAMGMNLWDLSAAPEFLTELSGNYIKWSNDFASDTGYDPQSTLAVTIRYSYGSYFTRTLIILNGELDVLRQNFGNILKKTILHEMGHTLGLDHSEVHSIMYPYISHIEELQEDDIDGAYALIDETIRRQEIGFQSPYSTSRSDSAEMASFAGCGTIDIDPKGGGNGLGNFIFSLVIGLFLTIFIKKFRKLRLFDSYIPANFS